MNRKTSLLTALQVAGGLSILAYPLILIADIMSFDKPGSETPGHVIVSLLVALYPLVWIWLFIFSRRTLSRGNTVLAFSLSSIPALIFAAAIGYMAFDLYSIAKSEASEVDQVRMKMEAVNPLVWTIWCMDDNNYPPTPHVQVEQALKKIEANLTLVNVEVPSYGAPLDIAVNQIHFSIDGSPGVREESPTYAKDLQHQKDMVRVARVLIGHGAHLGTEEKHSIETEWKVKMVMNDSPLNISSENPLVLRILTPKKSDTPFSVHNDDIQFLNKSTKLYGTPLCAALLKLEMGEGNNLVQLINAGAHLSKEEEEDPSIAAALKRAIADHPDIPSLPNSSSQ